ncbi:DNA polymerase III subunit epsilon [Micavibrio aeruginosavorus]|uniref:DNA polymerase III subunit epsilon n=1 Tax=Micavibrio aeruginosavorus (strain ARL-13) TaxID=856793 RepID=G2KNX6_MICAA|nr:DNA polymerase III subunit epsilon [Micavibrio aeruginosavorus]AEP10771.1 DNA polymerase III, epsilon subunit [Micavibrio aeruginosavorus ARL-13]
MREIVLDTETTGMDPLQGDRLVEIGCVELMNHVPTGRTYHQYINPERSVPAEAVAVHGLDDKFLKDKPVFAEIYTEFLDFIGDDGKLVIHNAEFDVKFLNAELANVGFPGYRLKDVTDTLKVAREKFPGSPASLDALCRRFGIDNSGRELHGALLDAQLLAEVYLELCGGRQHGLGLGATSGSTQQGRGSVLSGIDPVRRKAREKREFPIPADEAEAHEKLVASLTDAIWKRAD